MDKNHVVGLVAGAGEVERVVYVRARDNPVKNSE